VVRQRTRVDLPDAGAAPGRRVSADRRPQRHPDRPSAGRQILTGLTFLASDRVLVVRIGAVALASLAVTLINVADVFFVTVTLHGSAVILGLAQAMWMVGLLTGAASPHG
jgi:hypothetical protein